MNIKKINNKVWLVLLFFIILTLTLTKSTINSANPASRFLTMESLVENKTWDISENHIATNDKIKINNNIYSSKPPVFTFIGSGIYYVLHNFFDLDFSEYPKAACYQDNYYNLIEPNIVVYIITLLFIGTTFILLLFYLHLSFNLFKIKKNHQILLLLSFGLGTLYLPFSTVFNNHTIAGSFIFISFYYLLKIKLKNFEKDKTIKFLILSGFFISLATVIEIPGGGTFLLLFLIYLYISLSNKKLILYYIISTIPLILLHFILNYVIIGDLLPAQLHPEYWKNFNLMLEANDKNTFYYTFNIYFGLRGLFLYSPILLFSFYSIFKIIKDKKNELKKEAIMILSGFIIVSLIYILKFKGYSGSCYGFRWFISITPLIYFFTLYVFQKNIYKNNIKTIFEILILTSIIISIIGILDPWSNIEIILYYLTMR